MFWVTTLLGTFKYKWYIVMCTPNSVTTIYYDSKAQEVSPDDTTTKTATESTATRNNTRTGDNYTKNKTVQEVK